MCSIKDCLLEHLVCFIKSKNLAFIKHPNHSEIETHDLYPVINLDYDYYYFSDADFSFSKIDYSDPNLITILENVLINYEFN